ncbi:uncharacterized protein LTR77_002198 [Saxophila tyrrhenica]|uniref:Cytochrome P450 n=1 Tax=Saxophila tyrrhenica TaxID=1690608 RepID=A0AAV9PKM9_9PEZI|nr:hypothetical protein LTR77_002198 [Saxophila tyrrhenica]
MAANDRFSGLLLFVQHHFFLSTLVIAGFALVGYKIATYDKRHRHLPPEVPGWPIVNQTLLQQQEDAPPILRGWAEKYGEIFRTKAGVTTFIWLNSPESVKELFDRRSAIYSSRHEMPMAFQYATGGKRITLSPYNAIWRTSRAVFHKVLTPKMAEEYSVIQGFEAKQLSVDLLNKPRDFYKHNRRYAASVIFQVTYGWRIPEWDCDDVRNIFDVLGRFVQVRRPGQWTVDVVPGFADDPIFNMFSNWKKVGRSFHDKDNAIFMEFWNRLKRSIEDGTAAHCFGKVLQSSYEKQGLNESQAAWICGGLLEAGSETTSSTLNNFILLALSNPESIRLAHEELDRVVGTSRTPTFADERDLPFIRGMVKETLRLRPINKFGNNHCNTEDDWYKGYFIPKGSIVMANWWAIQFDPNRFPEPDKFLPGRWLDYPYTAAQAAAIADGTKRDHFTYGGGRRICAGMHVAEKSLFINIARLMWGFDMAAVDGFPLDFTIKGMQPGSGTIPKPFECAITPRSEQHERLMRDEWAQAEEEGIDFSHIKWSS